VPVSDHYAAEGAETAASAHRSLTLLRGARAGGPRSAAVLDLGSSSWRLVVYRYEPETWWRRTGQLQESALIAEGLDATGCLSAGAIDRGLATLKIFARYCRSAWRSPMTVIKSIRTT
jgi:hypothetical protein